MLPGCFCFFYSEIYIYAISLCRWHVWYANLAMQGSSLMFEGYSIKHTLQSCVILLWTKLSTKFYTLSGPSPNSISIKLLSMMNRVHRCREPGLHVFLGVSVERVQLCTQQPWLIALVLLVELSVFTSCSMAVTVSPLVIHLPVWFVWVATIHTIFSDLTVFSLRFLQQFGMKGEFFC